LAELRLNFGISLTNGRIVKNLMLKHNGWSEQEIVISARAIEELRRELV